MTTFLVEPQAHGLKFDDPVFLAAVAENPELFAAFDRFNETRSRLDPTFTPLVLDIPRGVIGRTEDTRVVVVSSPPYEYDAITTVVFEPPSEDDLSERDFFNPEESLLPELFARVKSVPELFVPSTIPDALTVAESEGFALSDQPQVPSVPQPDNALVSGPRPMIFPLEFKVPDDFDESEQHVFDVTRQTVPDAFTRPENLREAPEPPQFTVSPEQVVRPDILVPMLAVPTPVSDHNVQEPRGRRNRSVATLLDDETVEATSNVVPEVRYAEGLYAPEAVGSPAIEVLDEATVAVDAKKNRFARKPRNKEPKVSKVKVEKAPEPPKEAAPVVEGKPVSKSARKVKVGKQAKKTKSGEDADEKTTKPISEGRRRKRLIFTAAAVGFMIVFVLVGGFVGAKALGWEPSAVNTSKLAPALHDTDLVISKQAPMSSFSKGDLVVVRHPDSTLGYGIFYSAETTETIRMYNNVDLKPVEVAVDTLSRPVVAIPSVGTEVTLALNTPIPGILTVAAFAGVVGSVVLRRKA